MEHPIRIDENDCLTCRYRSPMFNLLSREELKIMNENRIPVVFKAGEIIRKQGTYMSHVISITSGLAKLYIEGRGNTNTIMRIVKPTNFIGGPAIYLDQIHHFTVAAVMETSVCFIDLNVFRKLLDTNKAFSEAFLKDFSRNVVSIYYRLIDLTNKQIPGRMADTLLDLFENVFVSNSFRLILTKHDLANLSAMSTDSANRILKEFHNEGIIQLSKNEVSLINKDALTRISKTG